MTRQVPQTTIGSEKARLGRGLTPRSDHNNATSFDYSTNLSLQPLNTGAVRTALTNVEMRAPRGRYDSPFTSIAWVTGCMALSFSSEGSNLCDTLREYQTFDGTRASHGSGVMVTKATKTNDTRYLYDLLNAA